VWTLALAASLTLCAEGAAQDAELTLVGWGIDARDLDAFMADAAEVGFDALITGSTDPEFLARAVEAAARHDIGVYAYITPMGHAERVWRAHHPDRPVPWQVMNEDEEAAFAFPLGGRQQVHHALSVRRGAGDGQRGAAQSRRVLHRG
jgi:hypothetical protein